MDRHMSFCSTGFKNQTQTFVIPSGSYIKSDAFCFLMKKELASSD